MLYLILGIGLVGLYFVVRGLRAVCGPLLTFELMQFGRRRSTYYLRCGYVLILLLILFGSFQSWFNLDYSQGARSLFVPMNVRPARFARFAETFFYLFLFVQFGVLMLLTPALSAGAIAEEREKGTLPLLMTTHVSPFQIVLSKLVSRMSRLLILLFAGLPFLGLIQLMGGLDPNLVIITFIVTLISTLTVACLSISCSAEYNTSRIALRRTYSRMSTYFFATLISLTCLGQYLKARDLPALFSGGNPLVFVIFIFEPSSAPLTTSSLVVEVILFVLLHLIAQSVMLLVARNELRRKPFTDPTGEEVVVEKKPNPVRELKPLSDDESPIYWREKQLEQQEGLPTFQGAIGYTYITALIILLVSYLTMLFSSESSDRPTEMSNNFLSVGGPFLCCFIYLYLALRGALTIALERERRTFESLLTLPLSNREILIAKLKACCWQSRELIYAWLVLLGLCGIMGGIHPLILPLHLLAACAQFAFALVLGMYCSVLFHQSWRATTVTLTVLLISMGGHQILTFCLIPFSSGGSPLFDALQNLLYYGLTAPVSLGTLTPPLLENLKWTPILYALLGTLIYAGSAFVLWRRLNHRLNHSPEI